ncbi:MAG: MlaD family protein [Acidimicrobiales bacterium]
MSARRWRAGAAAVALAVAALVLPGCARGPGRGPEVTAEFARGTGLYPGSPVRVAGIDVGKVAKVSNERGRVRVTMRLRRGARLPADARATIVPLTLLGERYVQLGPAWRSGPLLRDGAHIPLARTSVPAEIDDLLRSLQDFMGAIDPKRAGSVVTDLARLVDGRGRKVNALIEDASGTLELLARSGPDLRAIIASLRDLSATLKGRTSSIERVIRDYDLVTQVLVDNKGSLEGAIRELDRASVELTSLLEAHEDPLRSDVRVLADTGSTIAANTANLQITLRSTVKLFEAASRAYEARTNTLRVNNQASPELTSDLLAGRLRDRIAGLCRRLGIAACSDPASPLLNGLAGLLPGILSGSDQVTGSPPPSIPSGPTLPTATPEVPAPATPNVPAPHVPSVDDLLAALATQVADGLDQEQEDLLRALDAAKLAALLGLDPVLLQVLPYLDEDQVERLRKAKPEDLAKVMLDLYNEVRPPAGRLDVPLLPPNGSTTTTQPLIPGVPLTVPRLGG